MSESTSGRCCNHASSFQADLSKLVVWAHTHGTICNQTPALEFMQSTDSLSNDNAMLWMCRAGHAYHWHCGRLPDRGEEQTEAVGRRKRLLTSEPLARESSFEEKRLKVTPSSSEMGQADSGSIGSCGRSQGVTEQKADSTYTRNNKPRGSQNTSTSFSAEEQHFSMAGSRVQTGKQDMKYKSDEDLQIIFDEEQCNTDEDNQGDRISQDNVSESSAEELQILPCQEMALHQPAASQRAAFVPTTRPPPTRGYVLQATVSDSRDPSRNTLMLSPFTPAGPKAETSRARSLPASAAPEVCFKPLPDPSTETRAQLESEPSVTFSEFQATADIQQHLQLSPPECGTLGTGSSGDAAENMDEDRETSGSGQTPCSLASQSPETLSPAASKRDVQKQKKKKSYTTGGVKMFKEWLKLHHPSETREIHTLPPPDLNHYLVSFFSSAKRQNDMNFSPNSLKNFQYSINHYLNDHNYQYNIMRGPEFRAFQEFTKLNHLYVFQQGKNLSVVENLTDEDVENLLKKGVLSKTQPQGLLHLMFTNLIRGFGASTHHQAHQLYWGQVMLRKTRGEVEYLEWKDNLSPEGNEGKQSLRLFARLEDPGKCPVASYKEYARRRPPDMLNDSHPLYLTPKSLCYVWDKVWYCKRALTKARIGEILKGLTQEVPGAVRKTRR